MIIRRSRAPRRLETLPPADYEFGALSASGVIAIPAGSNGTYSLPSGNEAGHFAINGTTGEVTLAAGGVGNISGRYTLTRQNGATPTVYTVDIVADCLTVDPTHPYKKKIRAGWGGDGNGDVEYTLTPNKPVLMGHCVGDVQTMPWVLDPGGLTMDADPKPTTRTVSVWDANNQPNGTASQHVDGAVKNPAVAKGTTYDWQTFDERHYGFSLASQPTFPVSLAAGSNLFLSKSVDAGGLGAHAPKGAYSTAHSVFCLSVLATRPQGKIYRPGVWSGGKSWFASVPQIDQSVLSAVTIPPSPKNYSGGAVTLNWTTDWQQDGRNFMGKRYGPGAGLSLCGTGGTELGETLASCTIDPTATGADLSRIGYRWPYGISKQFTFARLYPSISSAEKQAALDQLIQSFIDLHSWAMLHASLGTKADALRNAEAQTMAGIAAKYLYDAGQQQMASDIWAWASTDNPTISGGWLRTNEGFHEVTNYLKKWTTGNRSHGTTSNGTYSATATDTTITFNSSYDWSALYGNTPNDRLVDWFYCQLFGVTNGGSLGAKRFMITGYNGTASSWNRTGGTFNVFPSFSSQGISAGSITEIRLLAGSDDQLSWASARSCSPIGYMDIYFVDDTTLPDASVSDLQSFATTSPFGSYWASRVGHWTVSYMASIGLTSPLWSGNLEANVPISTIKEHFRYKRELGDLPFQSADFDSNYENTTTFKAFYRYYLLDDLGFLGTNYVVPSEST